MAQFHWTDLLEFKPLGVRPTGSLLYLENLVYAGRQVYVLFGLLQPESYGLFGPKGRASPREHSTLVVPTGVPQSHVVSAVVPPRTCRRVAMCNFPKNPWQYLRLRNVAGHQHFVHEEAPSYTSLDKDRLARIVNSFLPSLRRHMAQTSLQSGVLAVETPTWEKLYKARVWLDMEALLLYANWDPLFHGRAGRIIATLLEICVWGTHHGTFERIPRHSWVSLRLQSDCGGSPSKGFPERSTNWRWAIVTEEYSLQRYYNSIRAQSPQHSRPAYLTCMVLDGSWSDSAGGTPPPAGGVAEGSSSSFILSTLKYYDQHDWDHVSSTMGRRSAATSRDE